MPLGQVDPTLDPKTRRQPRPTAFSNAAASSRSITRRIVDSSGGVNRLVNGSQRTPRTSNTAGGASATHSPIAASDCAPANTAATATSNNELNECRTPRRWRGSGTHAKYPRKAGNCPDRRSRSPPDSSASRSNADAISADVTADTALSQDHWTSTPE